MDDLNYGTRNKRGDWTPSAPLETGPLFTPPIRLGKILKWLPSYFLPWNVLFFAIALGAWWLTVPGPDVLKTLAPGWILVIWLRNMALILVIYGMMELRLYTRRRQGNRFKYNGKFPSDQPSDVFMFKSQNIDNIIRGFGTGIPIWTAYEVLGLWAWANGWGPWTTWAAHPVWLTVFGLLILMFHDVHFFCIHRLIHVPFLYKWVHSVHHNSVNPSPWSSLSMHPVEHLFYWSGSLIHLILPSHPILLIYHTQMAGVGAVVGHVGFDKVELGEGAIPTHAFAHYLHHKYFEVNYADGGIPLDKWFGTWHDGSREGDALMEARYAKKRARMNAAK